MKRIISKWSVLAFAFCLFSGNISAQKITDTVKPAAIQWDELDPRAIGFVKDYLDVHEQRLLKMKDWGYRYFRMIESILNKYGLPPSLKYLAVIESDLQANAISSAGAVGPWQLMPETAKELGLVVSAEQDDRTDLNKSTHAAAKLLSDLHKKMGDWLLVIAAYNCGPGCVDNVISRKKSRDFWKIEKDLPLESRTHVKKFIATHYIFERNGSETTGLVSVPRPEGIPAEEIASSDSILITGKYLDVAVAKYIEMDIAKFNRWNPSFNEKVGLDNYTLRIPKGKTNIFNEKRNEIIKESLMMIMQSGYAETNGFPPPVTLPVKTDKKNQKSSSSSKPPPSSK